MSNKREAQENGATAFSKTSHLHDSSFSVTDNHSPTCGATVSITTTPRLQYSLPSDTSDHSPTGGTTINITKNPTIASVVKIPMSSLYVSSSSAAADHSPTGGTTSPFHYSSPSATADHSPTGGTNILYTSTSSPSTLLGLGDLQNFLTTMTTDHSTLSTVSDTPSQPDVFPTSNMTKAPELHPPSMSPGSPQSFTPLLQAPTLLSSCRTTEDEPPSQLPTSSPCPTPPTLLRLRRNNQPPILLVPPAPIRDLPLTSTVNPSSLKPYPLLSKSPDDVLRDHLQSIQPPSLSADLSNLAIAFFNINSATRQKFQLLLQAFINQHLDVLCVLDTRIWDPKEILWYQTTCRTVLGPGSSIHFAPAQPFRRITTNLHEQVHTTAVGGQFIIKSPRISRTVGFRTDPSGCGAVATLHLIVGSTDIDITSVYCPNAPATVTCNDGSLNSKIQRYLDSIGLPHDTPHSYIHTYIADAVTKHHRSNGSATIVGGDWNAAALDTDEHQGTNPPLQLWAASVQLLNPYQTLNVHPTPTLFRDTDTAVGTLDHVYYRGSAISPSTISVCLEQPWTMSDHRPVVLSLKVNNWTARYVRKKARQRQRVSMIDIKRPTACQSSAEIARLAAFREIIIKRLPIRKDNPTVEESQKFVKQVSKLATTAARLTCKKTPGYEGWSPEVVALSIAQSTLIEMRRRACGLAHRTRWKPGLCSTAGVKTLCDKWLRKVSALSHSKDQLNHLLTLTDHGPSYWPTLTYQTLLDSLPGEIQLLGKHLHGRHRHELRTLLTQRRLHSEEARGQGRHLCNTKRLLNRLKPFFQLDELVDEEGNITTNPIDIVNKATHHFQEWHGAKISATFGFHDPDCDHKRLMTDKDYFLQQHACTNIPAPLLSTIWASLRFPHDHFFANPSNEMQHDIAGLSTTPTYDEFIDGLTSMPSKSAPGPSGLTYNMIASLPPDHLRHLYDHLAHLWSTRQGCPDWKWRLLAPLPKVLENITINDIRPLTLIETTRKLWVGLIINRVKSFWSTHKILHPSQHAYTEQRGVDSVHPQHRNLLEETRETCSSLFYTSWDIKRAFDRVSKTILVAAWARAGVPQDIAEYLVDFDTDGHTIVATPHTRNVLKTQGLGGFSSTDTTKTPCFVATVGTGQGDVSSPFNWNAFFDILLRALATVRTTPLHIRSEEHVLHPTEDSGYADDLISVSSRIEGIQDKADIVSAFSIIFGLDIATQKLRAVQIHWGSEDPMADQHVNIAVHTDNWFNVSQVPLLSWDHPDAKPIKYLGVLYDFDNAGRTQLAATRLQIATDLRVLQKTATTPQLKIETIEAGILSKARYTAKFSSWSLSDLEELDRLYSKAYRSILSLTHAFPTELLYGPPTHGCIGLKRFSDCVNMDKLSILFRALSSEAATCQAMNGLLLRAFRAAGVHPSPDESASAPFVNTASNCSLWASSLFAWLDVAGLRLTTGGHNVEGTAQERLDAYLHRVHKHLMPEAHVLQLNRSGLRTLSDVVVYNGSTNKNQWISSPLLPALVALPAHITRDSASLSHFNLQSPSLKPQQSWCVQPYDHVIEILGWDDPPSRLSTAAPTHMHVRKWLLPPSARVSSTRHISRNIHTHKAYTQAQTLLLDPTTRSLGAGSMCLMRYDDIFPPFDTQPIYAIVLSPDDNQPGNKGVQRTVLTSHVSPRPRSLPPSRYPHDLIRDLPHRLFLLLQHRDTLNAATIFTDASYTTHKHPVQHHFYPSQSTSTATGSIVFQPTDCTSLHANTWAIRIVDGHAIPNMNSFVMESLTLSFAAKLRYVYHQRSTHTPAPKSLHMPLVTDCLGALKLAKGAPTQPWKKPTYFLLRYIWQTKTPQDCFHWVRAHPETRTKDQSKWSAHEFGNHLADAFASSHPPQRSNTHPTTIELTAAQVLLNLLEDDSWAITLNGIPSLADPLQAVQMARLQGYLTRRDDNREALHKHRKWTLLSLTAAAKWHCMTTRQFVERSRVTKLMYDWYYHGTKKVQNLLTAANPHPMPLDCRLCGEPDSHYHMICGCSLPSIDNIRTKTSLAISTYIGTLQINSPPHICATTIRDMMACDSMLSPHLIWIGTWTPAHVNRLHQALPSLQTGIFEAKSTDPVYVALKIIGTLLAASSTEIVSQRHHAHVILERVQRQFKYRLRNPHPARGRTFPSPRNNMIRLNNHQPTAQANRYSRALEGLLKPTPKPNQKKGTKPNPPTQSHTIDRYFPHPLFDNTLNIPSSIHPHNIPTTHPTLSRAINNSHLAPTQPTHPTCLPTNNHPRRISDSLIGTRATLTTADHNRFNEYRHSTASDTIIVPAHPPHNCSLLQQDLRSLTMSSGLSAWANDSIINNFSDLLNRQSVSYDQHNSFICLSVFLFNKIVNSDTNVYSYHDVRKWYTRRRDDNPLLRNYIHIPTNFSTCHWTGITIDTKRHHVSYIDPAGGAGRQELYFIKMWLQDEIAEQLASNGLTGAEAQLLGNPNLWTYESNPDPSPQQYNDYDCGIFYLSHILYHAQGRRATYTEHMMPILRKQYFTALITQTLPVINAFLSPSEQLQAPHINTRRTLAHLLRPHAYTLLSIPLPQSKPIIIDLNTPLSPFDETNTSPTTPSTPLLPFHEQSSPYTSIHTVPTVTTSILHRPLFSTFIESTKRRGIG